MLLAAAAAAAAGSWVWGRRMGRGRPCPVWLAGVFDNPLTDAMSGVSAILSRADVREGMRVLDAGCGPGRLTIPLARRVGAAGEIVALDVQEGMLERMMSNATAAGVRNIRPMLAPLSGDMPSLTTERERFDRVMLVTVLGEIPDPAGAMRSLHAAMKPGGVLSVTEMIIDPDYQPPARVRRLAESAGFRLDRSYGMPLMFTMNFRKLT